MDDPSETWSDGSQSDKVLAISFFHNSAKFVPFFLLYVPSAIQLMCLFLILILNCLECEFQHY